MTITEANANGVVTATNNLHFYYDAANRPIALDFNGTKYFYAHNVHNDIAAILDSNGTIVVEYKYNAWGKLLATTGTLASTLGKLNPFRYRGYVYDEESGLYYLRNRYYNPAICRFINADSTKYLWNGTGPVIVNLFEFCNNNPVMGYDPDGTFDWRRGLTVGLAAIGVGLMLLAAAPTGGASLAIGGYLISGAAISSVGTTTVITRQI